MSTVKYSKTGRFIDLVKENAENGKNIQHPAITINPYGKHMDISYEEYYNIVCHSANYFYGKLNSLNFANSRNVGLLSMSDSHYLWNALGLMSINASPVMLSPRNSLEATIQLLKESNAQALVYQEYFEGFAKKVQEYIPELVLIPKWIAKFPECLSPEEYRLLVPLGSQEKELDNVAYILHSSGSTAHPKLIAQPNRVCHNSAHRTRVEAAPYNNKEISFLPLFHAGGIVSFVVVSIYLAKAIIMVPDLAIGSHFSSKMILDMIQELRPSHLMILPLMVKELIEYCDQVERSQGWDIFKIVKMVRYGGAELPRLMILSLFDNGITPLSNYGSTECSVLLKCIPNRNSENLTVLTPIDELRYKLKDWGDNTYELIILGDDPCLARIRDEDKDEDGNFPTKDLFRVLSHEPLLLNYLSRADDTIIHVNGEKTNPLPMEDKINRCPYIDRSAILGTGQQMNTLLVQLNVNEVIASPLSDVLSSIKSFVKLANDSAPSHSRIYDEMIYYIPMGSEKKLPGTIKGNLQRNLCAKMFKEEVKKTVEKMESGYVSDESRDNNASSDADSSSMESIVKSCLNSCIDKQIGNSESFFNTGMDSLSGMRFRNLLKSKIPNFDLKVNDIYDNDTVDKLVKYIELVKQGKMSTVKSLEMYQKEVDNYISRYSELGLEKPSEKQLAIEDFHIVISGANGSLGSFMIKNLIEKSNVTKVYALVRAKDDAQAREKLEGSFSQRLINIGSEYSRKIAPLAVKLHEEQLGLTKEVYESILPKLTHVYHVGWTMNFLKGLDYFEDCISASKNLMKLSVLSQRKVIYNFVSTIGAAFPTTSPGVSSISETKLSTKLTNVAICNGYNLSKLVTETVSQIWSQNYDIPIHIHRVGQISGDTINGAWNITEHFPLLVKGIQVMKICPNILESSVTWIPANTAANAIIEIGAQDQTTQNTFAHIINPLEYKWDIIYNALKSYGIGFEVVPIEEFINQLRTNPEFQNPDINPLATLTEFFNNVFLSGHGVILDTELTKLSSKSISDCPALDSELMRKYLDYWTSQKLF